MSTRKIPSVGEIRKRRQSSEFVGREDQLLLFRRNLQYDPNDDRRRLVFAVFGQGGVGKSSLLRRFREIATSQFAAVTAWIDEDQTDVPQVIGRIAEQLAAQDQTVKAFDERYRVYRQRRQELEADPDAPQGFASFIGRTLAKGACGWRGCIPPGALPLI